MAIVKRIAEMPEAAVSAADRPGNGAVFAIRFLDAIVAATAAERQLETAL